MYPKIKKILFTLALIGFNISIYAQDVITQKDGTDIQAKVLEITTTDVKYTRFDNQTGPTYTLPKTEVLMIRYQNGTKDIFNESNTSTENVSNQETGKATCEEGMKDAYHYYYGKNSGAGWTFVTTIIATPLIGLIPAAACSSQQPSDKNLNCPNPDLMKSDNYNRCYREQARKIKSKKVWKNYGFGAGVWLTIILLSNIF